MLWKTQENKHPPRIPKRPTLVQLQNQTEYDEMRNIAFVNHMDQPTTGVWALVAHIIGHNRRSRIARLCIRIRICYALGF